MAIERTVPEQWYATWPPDDTEESILGSDWHQLTITNLRLGINEIIRLRPMTGAESRRITAPVLLLKNTC